MMHVPLRSRGDRVAVSIASLRLVLIILAVMLSTVVWPASADSISGKIATVGFLSPVSRDQQARGLAAFMLGLRDFGHVEGQSNVIEWRFANGQAQQLSSLAADLVKKKVDVIAAFSTPAVQAAKQATSTIPIAMVYATDPVEDGLAVSLAHPGGNVTGLSLMAVEQAIKQLEFLKLAAPAISRVAIWRLPTRDHIRVADQLVNIGAKLGLEVKAVEVRGPEDYGGIFARMKRDGIDGVLVLGTPIHFPHRGRLADLAIQYGLPMASSVKEFAEAGFLLSFAPDIWSVYRQSGKYIDKLLKGAKPSELPIEQPTQFELVINLKTAKALAITVPEGILLRADEVIR